MDEGELSPRKVKSAKLEKRPPCILEYAEEIRKYERKLEREICDHMPSILGAILLEKFASIRDVISASIAFNCLGKMSGRIEESVRNFVNHLTPAWWRLKFEDSTNAYLTGSFLFHIITGFSYGDIDIAFETNFMSSLDITTNLFAERIDPKYKEVPHMRAVYRVSEVDLILVDNIKSFVNSFNIDVMRNYYNIATGRLHLGDPLSIAEKRAIITVPPYRSEDRWVKKYKSRMLLIGFTTYVTTTREV